MFIFGKARIARLAFAAILVSAVSCAFAPNRSGPAPTPGIPDLPPIPDDWRTILEISTLPLLQNNASGDASTAWLYANATLGAEVWILDEKENSGQADDFLADPSILGDLPVGPTGWPIRVPDGYSVSVSSYYRLKEDTPEGDLRSLDYRNMTGIYVITWAGRTLPDPANEGSQRLWITDTQNDGDPLVGTQILPAGDHRVIVKVRDPGRGVNFRYRSPDPADPIRDVRMWTPVRDGAGVAELDMSAYDAATMGPGMLSAYCTEPAPGQPDPIWHPAYLDHLGSDPSGVIRFMGFLNINGIEDGTPVDWQDRMPEGYTLTNLRGVDPFNYERHPVAHFRGKCAIPYEWLVDLANRSGKDAWLQVPHLATRDHIYNLATLVESRLSLSLRVWFELSNELGNNSGPYQPHYRAALAAGNAHGESQGWGSGRLQGEAIQAFENGWWASGGSDARCVNVLAGFQASPTYNAEALEGAASVDPRLAEVLAVTTYFGAGLTEELYELPYGQGSPGDEVYEMARECARSAIYRDLETWRGNGRLCRENGIGLIAYEGGSHILATGRGDWNNPEHAAFMRFLENLHKHPVMEELYLEHWAVWSAIGGRTASLFVDIGGYGYFGYWGAKEDVTESPDESPRWAALQEFAELQEGIRSMDEPIGNRPSIEEDRILRGEVGLGFAGEISASGGDGSLAIAVLGGRLPAGVSAASASGVGSASLVLSGAPASLETARFVVRASDADGDPDYAVISIVVDPEGTGANSLVLFDGLDLPQVPLERADGTEEYRTRFDPDGNAMIDDVAGISHALYHPVNTDAPLFNAHYLDSTVVLTATSPLNPSGAFALRILVDEYNASHDPDWDPARDNTVVFYGMRGRALKAWTGCSLDLPAGGQEGVPTVFSGLLLWRKDQMSVDPGAVVSFGEGSQRASLVLETDGTGADACSIRFVVREIEPSGSSRFYISEAEHDEVFSGRFSLVDFDDNPAPGFRWAPFDPGTGRFDMPDPTTLSFAAVDFRNVDRVGFAYRLYRTGWHYGTTFNRFVVIGVK